MLWSCIRCTASHDAQHGQVNHKITSSAGTRLTVQNPAASLNDQLISCDRELLLLYFTEEKSEWRQKVDIWGEILAFSRFSSSLRDGWTAANEPAWYLPFNCVCAAERNESGDQKRSLTRHTHYMITLCIFAMIYRHSNWFQIHFTRIPM